MCLLCCESVGHKFCQVEPHSLSHVSQASCAASECVTGSTSCGVVLTCHVDSVEQSRAPVSKLQAVVLAFKTQNSILLSCMMPQDGDTDMPAQQVRV